MSLNTTLGPVCRLCSYALKATAGCDICLPVKDVLIWPVTADLSGVASAAETSQLLVKVLRKRLRQLERQVSADKSASDHELTKALTSVARSLKEVGVELRKLEDREEAEYSKLGLEGRMQLFVEQFFAELPQDLQVKLLQEMKQVFQTQNAPLLKDVNEP